MRDQANVKARAASHPYQVMTSVVVDREIRCGLSRPH
jgi:hypothetical protein